MWSKIYDGPAEEDYDSNRSSAIAVFRGGDWYIQYQAELPMTTIHFGIRTHKAVPADYDGDKKTDYAVFRQGVWYIMRSSDNNYTITQFGLANDIPIPSAYSR